jgi:putative chitinase
MITALKLLAIGVSPSRANLFTEPLNAACIKHKIPSGVAEAAFVANLAVESAMFTRLEENLRYTTPSRILAVFGGRCAQVMQRILRNPEALANFVYANRLGNGNEASGDGWRYRGRGLIMLTGKKNYVLYDCDKNPDELALSYTKACDVAGQYWNDNHCTDLAIGGFLDSITRAINGPAMLENAKRKALTKLYLERT